MPPQQVQIQIPVLVSANDFSFNPQLLGLVDRRQYESGQTGRQITVGLAHIGYSVLLDGDADKFNAWYLSIYSGLAT